jgi:large subunit ribosomal protein L15
MPLTRRLPKFGFTSPFRVEFNVVNVETLQKLFTDGKIKDAVTPELLHSIGIVSKKSDPVKILGNGELKAKLNVSAHKFSKSAAEKITGAGGTITEIHFEKPPVASSPKVSKPVGS